MHLFGWWLVPSCYIQIQAVSVVSPLIYVVTCICCLIQQPKMPTSSNNDLKTSTCSKLLTWWCYMLMFLTRIFAMCLISNSECMSQHKWGDTHPALVGIGLQHQYMRLNQPLATNKLISMSRAMLQQFKRNTNLLTSHICHWVLQIIPRIGFRGVTAVNALDSLSLQPMKYPLVQPVWTESQCIEHTSNNRMFSKWAWLEQGVFYPHG